LSFAPVSTWRRSVPIALCVSLLTILALYSRRPDAFTNPQFWAEDAVVFFKQARHGISAVWTPYSGYLHLYERLVAAVCSHAPPADLPALYLVGHIIGVLFTALLCLSPRLSMPLQAKIAMACAVTMAPSLNEVFHTLTNTQWVLSLTLILLLLFDKPKSTGQWAFDVCLLLVVGLTGPFVLLFAPLFVLRAAIGRDRHGYVLLAIALAAVGIQLLHMHAITRVEGPFGAKEALAVLRAANGYVGQTFAGKWGRPAPEGLRLNLLLLGSALLLHAALLLDAWRRRRPHAFYFLGGGAAVLLPGLFAWRADSEALVFFGDRYFYIPITLLVWTLIDALPTRGRVVAPLLLLAVAAFVKTHRSSPTPDLHWREASQCLQTKGPCAIPILPNWTLTND
jgi:hypothetical protein